MANKIILKKSSVATKVPVAGDLDFGELAINYTDSKLYFKKADGSIDSFVSSAGSSTVTSVGGNSGAVTDTQLLTSIKNVDGSGSGLDADLLDGNHASAFYLASNPSGYTSNTGTVTSVGATAPIVSSGGTTPSLSIAAANSTTNGYMSSAYATKLDGIAAGATNVTNTNQLVNGAGYLTSAVTSFSAGTTGLTPSSATTGVVTLAGTLATANGGTGLTSFTANGIPYASSTSTLTTGSALSFNGNNLLVGTTITPTGTGKISTPSGYTAPDNAAGAGTTLSILGSTGTGIAGPTGGNGVVQIIGGGGTSPWTSFVGGRRRGGILLQAGRAAGDAGATYFNGSTINILGSNSTNNGTTTGAGSQIQIIGGHAVSPAGTNNGGSINLSPSSSSSAGGISISGGYGGASASSGGNVFLGAGNCLSGTAGSTGIGAGNSTGGAGGTATVTAGNSTGVAGANVSIISGTGTTNGKIGFTIGALGEVAQISPTGDFRASLFYDSDNTGYYCDPNSTSNLNGLILSGSSYFRPQSWIQFDGSYGLYWPNNNGAHLHANDLSTYTQIALRGNRNSYGGIYDQFSGVNGIMYDGSGNGGIYREANAIWYQYYNVSNDCTGFGTSGTNSAYNVYTLKGLYSGGRVDSTIFYDSGNTAFYLDPNTTGTSLNVAGAIVAGGNITAFSDENLKADWNQLPADYVEKLSKLLSGTFTRKDTGQRQAGVGAQSLQQFLPEAVVGDTTLSVAYGNAAMVSAVELAKRIVEQDARIALLEERLSKLLGD